MHLNFVSDLNDDSDDDKHLRKTIPVKNLTKADTDFPVDSGDLEEFKTQTT